MRWPAAALVAAAGCATLSPQPLPDDLTPVDIQSAISGFETAYPDVRAFSALDYDGHGVIFGTDGTAIYVSPAQNSRVDTTVSGFDGNTICLAEAGDFPGLCIDLYETKAQTYYCDGTFGDGKRRHYDCTIIPARDTI